MGGKKMRKVFTKVLFIVFLFVLSACTGEANSKTNTIAASIPTEREHMILSAHADQSFLFDFKTDEEFKEVSVWIEKYEDGKLVNDQLNEMTTEISERGSIVFSSSKIGEKEIQKVFHIGVSSDKGSGSVRSYDEEANHLDFMSSLWGSFPEAMTIDQDEIVLANISHSNNDFGMSSLSTEFYNDPEGNMDKLKDYDVVYLLKARFGK